MSRAKALDSLRFLSLVAFKKYKFTVVVRAGAERLLLCRIFPGKVGLPQTLYFFRSR